MKQENESRLWMLTEMGLAPVWKKKRLAQIPIFESEQIENSASIIQWHISGESGWVFVHEPLPDHLSRAGLDLLDNIVVALRHIGVNIRFGFFAKLRDEIMEREKFFHEIEVAKCHVLFVQGSALAQRIFAERYFVEHVGFDFPQSFQIKVGQGVMDVVCCDTLDDLLIQPHRKALLWQQICAVTHLV